MPKRKCRKESSVDTLWKYLYNRPMHTESIPYDSRMDYSNNGRFVLKDKLDLGEVAYDSFVSLEGWDIKTTQRI